MNLKSFNIFELTKININSVVPITTHGSGCYAMGHTSKKYLYLLTRLSLQQNLSHYLNKHYQFPKYTHLKNNLKYNRYFRY